VVNTYTSYRLIAADITKSLERVSAQPEVQRETEYYLENIGNVKSIEDLVEDRRLFAYAMKAHGLSDMTYAKAFMVKAMEGGIDDEDSFVNKLTDQRYTDFVETFNFVRNGEATTAFAKTQQGTVDKYLRQTLEEDAGDSNEGVRLALNFERNAASIETAYDLLANSAYAKVVRTVLGLPDSFATADIDKQAAMIEERIDIEDFQDPEALDKFLTRFTAMWEIQNPTSTASSSIAALFSQPVEYGISSDVMLTLQGLKLGGS
jgi:hypothetical protein